MKVAVGWYVNGKELNHEEYKEYLKKDLEERQRIHDEAQRLIAALGEAYKTCTEFLAQHPETPYPIKDGQAQEHALFQKLRQSLERADRAPRCEKVREDGTVCGCPQMKGYRYCYAHERMLQTQSQKLQLPALEDANAVQMAIMRVQKALIDDEISEKKAGLLLYSLQMASSNLKHTTFTKAGEKVIVEMTEPPRGGTSRVKPANGNWQLANSETQHLTTETQRHGETLSPQINADERGSEKQNRLTTEDTKEHGGKGRGNGRPQPGAAVPHEHRVG